LVWGTWTLLESAVQEQRQMLKYGFAKGTLENIRNAISEKTAAKHGVKIRPCG
jgi:hypothetical protein